MPKKEHSTGSTASSWWKERGKIVAMKTEPKSVKAKSKKVVRTKKAQKAEKGKSYICEICGCEMECVSDSSGAVICCETPMSLIC